MKKGLPVETRQFYSICQYYRFTHTSGSVRGARVMDETK